MLKIKLFFREYWNSLDVKKNYWLTLIADTIYFLFCFFSLTIFFQILRKKSLVFTQGRTPQQIQELLLSGELGPVETYLSAVKTYALTMSLGFIVLAVSLLLLYSLTKSLIWNYLLGSKLNKKTYWRWNWLNIFLFLALLIYLIPGALLVFITEIIVSALTFNATVLEVVKSLITFFLIILFLTFIFLCYYSFTKKYRVFESVGQAFHLCKVHWKKLLKMLLLTLLTGAALSSIIILLSKVFLYIQPWLTVINFIISLMFLAWMRIYFLEIIKT